LSTGNFKEAKMTFASDKLKILRKRKKLTQNELANLLGISQKSYSNWENNKAEPTLENIVKLANILETTTDELLGRHVDFGDRVLFNISNYNLSNLKEFNEQELYDLKATIVLELLDESMNTLTVKNKLTTKNKLDKDEEIILDTIIMEAKTLADEIIEFENFRKSKQKFKWPWQKERSTNLTPKQSNTTKSE